MYDIAHNGNHNSQTLDSVFFPLARHKSWYDGHSFATGLFPFGNGKSQESSSEAVNAYYGAYLWSMVREGAQDDPLFELTDFARLLLATEIRGARTYWHLLPPEELSNKTTVSRPIVYNPGFLKNYMVGNLGMTDVVCSTWFGTASLYVHMINFMPLTAITSVLFYKSFVEREFNSALAPILANVEMAWLGYVIADQAIVDPVSAWREAQNLASYELDSALSKSQVLYWISTRPGFNATVPSSDKSNSTRSGSPRKSTSEPDTKSKPNSQSTMCEDNQACAKLGLTGFCCPTSTGSFLGCCSTKKL
jgi:endo-1,3(4)-beta-glucanase